jgi:hypothetical protein
MIYLSNGEFTITGRRIAYEWIYYKGECSLPHPPQGFQDQAAAISLISIYQPGPHLI